MDFTLQQPKHWIAGFFIAGALLLFTILPLLTFFGIGGTGETTIPPIGEDGSFGILFEVMLLMIELILVYFLFVIAPLLWYVLVNNLHLPQILQRLQLHKKNLGEVFAWSLATVFLIFVVTIIIDFILVAIGVNTRDVSNIPQIENLFSLPSIFVLLLFQSAAEEFFYRGFLFEKITKLHNQWTALVITSVLFGLAHLMFNNFYPALLSMIAGAFFGFALIKSKNLLTPIIAHIVFNFTSIIIYIFGQNLFT